MDGYLRDTTCMAASGTKHEINTIYSLANPATAPRVIPRSLSDASTRATVNGPPPDRDFHQ